jgi:hypothetical protein
MKTNKLYLLSFCLAFSCNKERVGLFYNQAVDKDKDKDKDTRREIVEFLIEPKFNTDVKETLSAVINPKDNVLHLVFPPNVPVGEFFPTIVLSSAKEQVAPPSGEKVDFASVQTYMVTAANGEQRTYTTNVLQQNVVPSSSKVLLFWLDKKRNNNLTETAIGKADAADENTIVFDVQNAADIHFLVSLALENPTAKYVFKEDGIEVPATQTLDFNKTITCEVSNTLSKQMQIYTLTANKKNIVENLENTVGLYDVLWKEKIDKVLDFTTDKNLLNQLSHVEYAKTKDIFEVQINETVYLYGLDMPQMTDIEVKPKNSKARVTIACTDTPCAGKFKVNITSQDGSKTGVYYIQYESTNNRIQEIKPTDTWTLGKEYRLNKSELLLQNNDAIKLMSQTQPVGIIATPQIPIAQVDVLDINALGSGVAWKITVQAQAGNKATYTVNWEQINCSGTGTESGFVLNPKEEWEVFCWQNITIGTTTLMDRNLGAMQTASSFTDSKNETVGYYYQWNAKAPLGRLDAAVQIQANWDKLPLQAQTHNQNAWDTQKDPCPEGYSTTSSTQMNTLANNIDDAKLVENEIFDVASNLTTAKYISAYWTKNYINNNKAYARIFDQSNNTQEPTFIKTGLPIRCVKN